MLLSTLLLAATQGHAQQSTAPPVSQKDLDTWWTAAGEMWMGDTEYVIGPEGLSFEDGVCSFSLSKGVLIPVYSGRLPVSERMVGLVFMGQGELDVRFPERSDAWMFSNHMQNNAGIDPERITPLQQGEPFQTRIDRGMILSADPETIKLLYNLEPVRSGVMISGGEDGYDEEFVVTENRGGLRARIIGTNVLANRQRQLEKTGFDAQAIIRQDRLLHEELGLPGDQLRMIADFRTQDAYRVAEIDGRVLGNNSYDHWMTCYRDGQDMADTGYQTMAFSHGTDTDQRRHFMRFSGDLFHADTLDSVLRPPVRMDPVHAESGIEITPFRRGLEQQGTIKTTMTVRAVGAAQQHIAMRLPTGSSIKGTWRLKTLALEDGTPLAYAALHIGLTKSNTSQLMAASDIDGANAAATDTSNDSMDAPLSTLGGSGGNDSSLSGGSSSGDTDGTGIGLAGSESSAYAEQIAFIQRRYRYDIITLLPEPVPVGEEITIVLEWEAKWSFANFSVTDSGAPDGTNVTRSLGPTTGQQPFLPELLPAPGGTIWSHETTVGIPTPLFRPTELVISGDTTERWVDDGDNWKWVRTNGEHDRNPVFSIGRWYEYAENGGDDSPSVRVNLFPSMGDRMVLFPSEIRQVVSYYDRFLPSFPRTELEVFQGPTRLSFAALTGSEETPSPGILSVQTVRPTTVTTAGALQRENPHHARRILARQIAGQYWGQSISPASSRDAWVPEAMANSFAYFYIRGVFGFDAYAEIMAELRDDLENPYELSAGQGANTAFRRATARRRALSLTNVPWMTDIPAQIRNAYGTYVIAEMLRNRLGDQIFFGALDSIVAERNGLRMTTEQLQLIFEEAAGHDLSDFFDYWIHGGFIPEVTLEYQQDDDGTVRGCILSDVPYGVFDVPIRVVDQDGERMVEAMRDVVHGKGFFEVPARDADAQVELDPYGMILSAGRTVKEVKDLTCEDIFEADAATLE
jgi:hypothetical protein